MMPEGQILARSLLHDQAFLFDCRSAPPPQANLTCIFNGVCQRSGYFSVLTAEGKPELGCAVTQCRFNERDDARLIAIRSSYQMLPVGSLRVRSELTTAAGPLRLRCVYCAIKSLYAVDGEDMAAASDDDPLQTCPHCGAPLARSHDAPLLAETVSDHELRWLGFDPPLTSAEAQAKASKPDLNEGPVCDPARFHPGADLQGQDLRGEILSRAQLKGALLKGAQLQNTPFVMADLRESDFTGAALTGADLMQAKAAGVIFDHATMTSAIALKADFQGARFRSADLREAILDNANLTDADLSGADLSGISFEGATLTRANLSGARLHRANLRGAVLIETNLQRADLTGSDLSQACLSQAAAAGARFDSVKASEMVATNTDLSRTEWKHAVLTGAVLTRSTFFASQLHSVIAGAAMMDFTDLRQTRAEFCDFSRTDFRGADFRGAKLLDCNLSDASLIWARSRPELRHTLVNWPAESQPSFSPGVAPPDIEPKPVYRLPADSGETDI